MGRLMWIQWAEMLHLQGSQEGSAEKEAFLMRKMAFQEESSIRERSKEFQGNQREGPQGLVGAWTKELEMEPGIKLHADLVTTASLWILFYAWYNHRIKCYYLTCSSATHRLSAWQWPVCINYIFVCLYIIYVLRGTVKGLKETVQGESRQQKEGSDLKSPWRETFINVSTVPGRQESE